MRVWFPVLQSQSLDLQTLAALGGTLSSYTWICMILNFLQTRNPPILPSLHKRPHMRRPSTDGKVASFDDDVSRLKGHGYNNKESVGELLFNFFRRYAHDVDYEKQVISVREGRLVSKEAKKWHLMQNNRLCVEEPFNTERNLGNTADDISFRGIHLELRRAFDFISDSKLDKCLDEYEFPITEEKTWEKPQPKPTPVLRSRSQSQSSRSNRGGYGNRGGRHGQYKSNSRRASSAAAPNKYPFPLNDVQGFRGREFAAREQQTQYPQEQALALHQYLMLEMQNLHEHEQRLRLLQAQAQQASLRESNERSISQHQHLPRDPAHRSAVLNQVPLSAPLRQGQFYSSYAYPQVPGTPVHSVHTQPSSPSMKAAQPDLRRALHRPSGPESGSGSARSHSQPARPLPMPITMQGAPPLPLNSQSFLQYQQQLRQHQQQVYGAWDMSQGRTLRPDGSMFPDLGHNSMDFGFDDNVPKEYVGYWVNEAPSAYQYRDDHMMHHMPTYQDLHPRARGVPPTIDRLRRSSRSPSPSTSLPFRDRSYSVRSASSAPIGPSRYEHGLQQPSAVRTGPVIVNGADGWNTSEYPPAEYSGVVDSSSHTTISEATSGSDDQHYETPVTGDMEAPFTSPPFEDGFVPDGSQQLHPNPAGMEVPRIPHSNRKTNLEPMRNRPPPQLQDGTPSSAIPKRLDKSQNSAGGLGIQFGEVEITRPTKKSESSASQNASTNSVQASKVESDPITPKGGQFDKVAVPVPLLSPVREVRTPSPTGKGPENGQLGVARNFRRIDGRLDLRIPSFAELVRAKQQKQQDAAGSTTGSIHTPNGTQISSKLSENTRAYSTSPSSIDHDGPIPSSQTPSSPKGTSNLTPTSPRAKGSVPQPQTNGWQQQSSKKNRKNRSRPGSVQYASGEPLPINEAERKGG